MVVVVCVMMVVVEGQQQERRRDWGECGPVVCGEVERQAQSLARLKLLRTYITQSVSGGVVVVVHEPYYFIIH